MTSQKPTVPSSSLVQSKGHRVVLSTIGRFHTFDFARQLHKRSALTAIFSGYPWFKLSGEQLPRHLVYTFPWLHAPYMRFAGVIGDRSMKEWEWWDPYVFDLTTALRLPDCDVFCGLSSSGLRTGLQTNA